jgi:glycosyltransferase involved in cell wall biosynthesis
MKVNVAVCGKFHYHNYLEFIVKAGLLNEYYYSHKRGAALPSGVDPRHAHNFFLKEYLTFLHLKFGRGFGFQSAITLYQDLWQFQALRNWRNCDILHVLNHGAAIQICSRAKENASVVLGEPVNSHPAHMFSILAEEHERLGIPYFTKMPTTFLRMTDEIEYFDYVLSPSRFVTKSFVERGFSGSRIFTVPFGVDLRAFSFRNLQKDKFRVIYVAQITPRKGHIDLLDAWSSMNLPLSKAELVLVGHIDPVMEPILEKYKGKYTYAGTLSRADVIQRYNTASVFVMPSLEEGCSYAPLEAMACGLPVILTENTGSGELITHGQEGFIIPIRNPEQIAHYLGLIYTNPSMRAEMGQAALRKASENFGWDTYAARILEIYKTITNDHMTPAQPIGGGRGVER